MSRPAVALPESDVSRNDRADAGLERNILGIPIFAETMREALDRIHRAISTRAPLHIGVVNAAKIVNMCRNAELHAAVVESDVIYADGMSVVWASRWLGRALPERVAGIDLMLGILERGNAAGYRIYCLGATQGVLESVCEKFVERYPGVTIAGNHHGYFGESGEEAVAKQICAADADVLFVAMTSPKKERFMERWHEVINVPVIHGVGGSFDVIAGLVERAPVRWQRWGLEWLYRLKQEPRRLWKRYLVTNLLFLKLLVAEKIRLVRAVR